MLGTTWRCPRKENRGKVIQARCLVGAGAARPNSQSIARHLDVFAWTSTDMPGINPNLLGHRLTMDNRIRPVVQRRRKFNEERRLIIKTETQKLLSVGHIREIQYPEWLANVVLVRKANDRWRMCVDFTDLNKVYRKDSYPLPSIDSLVDSASGCRLLSLKNVGATYQCLMERILTLMLGRNMKAYEDDMVVTFKEKKKHVTDLEEYLETIGKYNLKLNPKKCEFGVEAGKFLGFMLTDVS